MATAPDGAVKTGTADEDVVTASAMEPVVPLAAVHGVCAAATVDPVVPTHAADHVVTRRAGEPVAPSVPTTVHPTISGVTSTYPRPARTWAARKSWLRRTMSR